MSDETPTIASPPGPDPTQVVEKNSAKPKRVRKRRRQKAGEPIPAEAKTPRATKKGRAFAENAAKGMNNTDAATEAGYAPRVARDAARKIWNQKGVLAHYQRMVQRVLPPERVTKILDELLEGKTVTKHLRQEAVKDASGKMVMQAVGGTLTETIDRGVQLRALALAAEHGGLIPSAIRAPAISEASLEEVLERAEKEYIKHGEMMTPTWLLERAKRLGMEAPVLPEAPKPEPEPVNACDACGEERCSHGRCPGCEACETCDVETPVEATA